jgi:hypothetical protein
LLSSAVFAQTYIPVSPPPAAVAPPAVGVPGSTTTTTTTSPTTDHATTITKGVDANGNEIEKKDSYREGNAGRRARRGRRKLVPTQAKSPNLTKGF